MKQPLHLLTWFALLCITSSCWSDVDVWTDPDQAALDHPDFLIQGEYTGEVDGKRLGVQAADMDEGQFLVATYQAGLPGAGWDGSEILSQILTKAELKEYIQPLQKVRRKSETEGKAAPEGALIIFNGEPTELVKGKIENGFLWAGSQTTQATGSFVMHLEYRLPFKPGRKPSSQDRGNSGVYIFNNYECQVLDSFALDLKDENVPFEVESGSDRWCSAFYKFKTPDLPMVFPPLTWQTLDIDFTAPVFEEGKKVKNARVTVHHNGVPVHNDVELPKGTGGGGNRPEKEKGMIFLQGHGNPVAYRNFWILEK